MNMPKRALSNHRILLSSSPLSGTIADSPVFGSGCCCAKQDSVLADNAAARIILQKCVHVSHSDYIFFPIGELIVNSNFSPGFICFSVTLPKKGLSSFIIPPFSDSMVMELTLPFS